MIDWANIVKFCFTYALPDGAWLQDANGCRTWAHASEIVRNKGQDWYTRNVKAHGMFTGCWIEARN